MPVPCGVVFLLPKSIRLRIGYIGKTHGVNASDRPISRNTAEERSEKPSSCAFPEFVDATLRSVSFRSCTSDSLTAGVVVCCSDDVALDDEAKLPGLKVLVSGG